jgi:hypothetical protein
MNNVGNNATMRSLRDEKLSEFKSEEVKITSIAFSNINMHNKTYEGKVFLCLHCSQYSVHFTEYAVRCHVNSRHKSMITHRATNRKIVDNYDELYVDFTSHMDKDQWKVAHDSFTENRYPKSFVVLPPEQCAESLSVTNHFTQIYELQREESMMVFAVFNDSHMHRQRQDFKGEVYICLHCVKYNKAVHFAKYAAMCHVTTNHKSLLRRKPSNKKVVENYEELFINFTPHMNRELWRISYDTYLQNKFTVLPSDFADFDITMEDAQVQAECLRQSDFIDNIEKRILSELQYHPDYASNIDTSSVEPSSVAAHEEILDEHVYFTPFNSSQISTPCITLYTSDVHMVTPEAVKYPEVDFLTPTDVCAGTVELDVVTCKKTHDVVQ